MLRGIILSDAQIETGAARRIFSPQYGAVQRRAGHGSPLPILLVLAEHDPHLRFGLVFHQASLSRDAIVTS